MVYVMPLNSLYISSVITTLFAYLHAFLAVVPHSQRKTNRYLFRKQRFFKPCLRHKSFFGCFCHCSLHRFARHYRSLRCPTQSSDQGICRHQLQCTVTCKIVSCSPYHLLHRILCRPFSQLLATLDAFAFLIVYS
jgi:hypothetical protein